MLSFNVKKITFLLFQISYFHLLNLRRLRNLLKLIRVVEDEKYESMNEEKVISEEVIATLQKKVAEQPSDRT